MCSPTLHPPYTHMQTTYLVVNNVEKAQDSYKSRIAGKWGIPVVSTQFVTECLSAGKLLEADPFLVVGKTAAEQFSTGKIIGKLFVGVQSSVRSPVMVCAPCNDF